MAILVTGLSGFVGSYCAEQMPDALDLLRDSALADIRQREQVREGVARARPEAVIHLAGLTSVAGSIADPAETFRVNFEGTRNLLDALRDCEFRGRLLYVGSADAYGVVPEDELPVTEDRRLCPLNPYAASKAAAEALCHEWSRTGPFDIVMARPFNHIGPRQSTRFAVADFARQIALARKGVTSPVLTVGDIDTTRDFSDVRDVVRAYMLLLEHGRSGQIYNVCSGTERSLREVIHSLCETAGVEMEIRVAPDRLRPADQRRMRGSYQKLRSETGWEPAVGHIESLRDILRFWMEKETT